MGQSAPPPPRGGVKALKVLKVFWKRALHMLKRLHTYMVAPSYEQTPLLEFVFGAILNPGSKIFLTVCAHGDFIVLAY